MPDAQHPNKPILDTLNFLDDLRVLYVDCQIARVTIDGNQLEFQFYFAEHDMTVMVASSHEKIRTAGYDMLTDVIEQVRIYKEEWLKRNGG